MYDLRELKAIPCGDVASKYGIQLKERGNRLIGKLRENEKTASFSINIEKNLWYDFGSKEGGSVIDLVMNIKGVGETDAINILAEDYGFEKERVTGWRPLTDRQYRELGIQPEKATMNFRFDLDKHSFEQLERWSKKYDMTVRELAEKYPKAYNKMVIKLGMEEINVLKDTYYARVNMFHDPTNDSKVRNFIKLYAKGEAEELNRKIDILQRGVKPSYEKEKIDYSYMKVNYEEHFSDQAKATIYNQQKITNDEVIRDRIVKVYKKLFNYDSIENFSVEQAKALQDINSVMVKGKNQYLPVDGIMKTYDLLGKNLERLENKYTALEKQGAESASLEEVKEDLLKVKELFNKCNKVVEGIREADLALKNEQAKENIQAKDLQKNIENSL